VSDRIKAMNFDGPEYVPVSVGILPSAWIKHREALDAIVRRYPRVFGEQNADRDYDAVGGTYVAGEHVDVWGCVWSNVHTGREAIVTGHPVPTRQAVRTLTMPTEDAGLPHGFMYLRLQDLRGFEELMIDFAEEPPELQQLIDIVLEYNLRQVRLRIAKARAAGAQAGRSLYFGDDLGTQKALVRGAGFSVYMHSDGQIFPIIQDLIECGVNVINPQIRANGLDNLVATCKGRVCVDLDLDRQLFPFCTPADIDAHVRQAVEALGSPEGGLWLTAEVDDGVPLENVEAICAALDKYRGFFRNDHGART